ncbi:MAG TPA: SDR family NAD(P)-dependent oxidoreductase, partial [Chloroflexota bacterium]|nr:SDR family NAD(P)-dependent oxidoreductase [Chloroflexota bacterium]
RVAVTGRREDRLNQLAAAIEQAGGQAAAFPADLTSEGERDRLVSAVRERFGRIDVLVNNAGLGWFGRLAELPAERRREILAVNVEAPVHLTGLVLPEMLARHSGHIVNVASIAGNLATPTRVLYSASKAFVQRFDEGLRRELRGTGVRVSTINPGPVRTEFRRVAIGVPVSRRPELESGVPPERVARAILAVLCQPRKSVYVPGYFRVMPFVALLFGGLLDRFAHLIAWTQLRGVEKARRSNGEQ